MKVTNIRSRTVKTYTVTVGDGEVRDQPYSRTGRQYKVDRVVVTKRDGNLDSVKLSGAVLKKDGTPGANAASESLYRQDEMPAWLRSIVGGLA